MRRLDIVLCVIRQGDYFILQKRSNDPRRGGAGLIGFFGGKIEADESALAATCREVSEETSLLPKETDLQKIGTVHVTSDHNLEEVDVYATVFNFMVSGDMHIKAHDGTLVRMTHEEALQSLGNFTPGTRACFEQLI